MAAQHPDIVRQPDAIAKKEHRCRYIQGWGFIDRKFSKPGVVSGGFLAARKQARGKCAPKAAGLIGL